jgi:hypothetical protein
MAYKSGTGPIGLHLKPSHAKPPTLHPLPVSESSVISWAASSQRLFLELMNLRTTAKKLLYSAADLASFSTGN